MDSLIYLTSMAIKVADQNFDFFYAKNLISFQISPGSPCFVGICYVLNLFCIHFPFYLFSQDWLLINLAADCKHLI
jgi:hypothetical protein